MDFEKKQNQESELETQISSTRQKNHEMKDLQGILEDRIRKKRKELTHHSKLMNASAIAINEHVSLTRASIFDLENQIENTNNEVANLEETAEQLREYRNTLEVQSLVSFGSPAKSPERQRKVKFEVPEVEPVENYRTAFTHGSFAGQEKQDESGFNYEPANSVSLKDSNPRQEMLRSLKNRMRNLRFSMESQVNLIQ